MPFFYALTSYPVIEEKHLHGEVVGFGVLLALLVDQQYEEFEKNLYLKPTAAASDLPGTD